MFELAGHLSNAAEAVDHFPMGFHSPYVRCQRTNVNGENVQDARDKREMPNHSVAEAMNAIWKRSGLSYREVAKRAGYAGASSVQRYLDGSFDGDFLPITAASKLVEALEGRGDPPITREEIMNLTALSIPSNAQLVQFAGKSPDSMQNDIPVYGTALGAPKIVEGAAIEQTTLNTGEILTYFKRPVALAGRKNVYGLYIQGSSMSPRFEEGEIVLVQGQRPPRVGDDVVVYLRAPDESYGETATACLIKRLVRRTSDYVELEQFSPAKMFRIPVADVGRIDRVIPWAEIFS